MAVQGHVDQDVLAAVQVVEMLVVLLEFMESDGLEELAELVVQHLPCFFILYAHANIIILILSFSLLS